MVVPALFLALALPFGSRQYHWDTLERAYLLEHPGRYIKSWDGSPRSQFLSFAHVLELPLAGAARAALGGGPGLRALRVMEAVAGAGVLLLLALTVGFWGGANRSAVAAQVVLAASWAFWKMGTSGEERILALATLLLFLLCFWRALAGGKSAVRVAATLALAVLAHTSAVILVPFAAIALLVLPAEWKAHRRAAALGVAVGALAAAILYTAVAAWTTHVRTPWQLYEYATFFHRDAGNNFFEPPGSARTDRNSVSGRPAQPRLLRVGRGWVSFFGKPAFPGGPVLALLGLAILWARFQRRSPAPPAAPSRHPPARDTRVLCLHALILAGLWATHFAFYEPENTESWTVPATLAILVAAVPLVPGTGKRSTAALAAAALLLLAGNARAYAQLHAPMPLARYHAAVRRAVPTGDIVLLVGGIQNGRPLRGSISMRYFLAAETDRTVASLFDVLQITSPEYWDRPVPSVEALQAALVGGRRAWFPAFLEPDFAAANASGRVRLSYAARGDSVFEITRVERP